MVRLPDIGFSEWIADQQAEFQRSTQGYFDSLEFRDAASQLEELIPKDFPTIGGQDTWEEEQRRIQEAEQRRQEQEAAIREAQMDAAQAAWMQQQQEAEANRQRDLMMQAQQEASSYGIPTPGDVFNEFAGLEGRPLGTGHPDTSSGVFDAVDQAPAPVVPTLDAISPDQAASEFSSVVPPSPRERLLEGVDPRIGRYDFGAAANTISSIPSQISDVASSIPGQVSSAASTIWDSLPGMGEVAKTVHGVQSYPVQRALDFPENAQKNASAIWETGIKPLAAPWQREGEKLAPLYEEARVKTAEADRVRAEEGLPPMIDLTSAPIQDSARSPRVRASDEIAAKAAQELARTGLKAGLKASADSGDAALMPAGLDRENFDISNGLGEKFGVGKIGIADAVVNLAPGSVMFTMQGLDLVGSFLEDPEGMTVGLSALGALALLAKKNPKGAIAAVGGLAAGADSLYNQRDVYQEGDGYDLKDTLLETTAGAAAGGTLAYGTVPTIKATGRTVVNTIKAIASSPTFEEALTRLDVAGGRALDLVGDTSGQVVETARKYPAVATALGITAGAAAGDAVGDYLSGSAPDEAAATPSMAAGAVVGGMAAAGGKAAAVEAAGRVGRELAPTFYSKLEQVVKSPKLAARVTPNDLERFIQNNQVKADELQWTGMDDWIKERKAQGGFITRDELNQFIDENKIEVRDVELERVDDFADEFDPYALRTAPNSGGRSFTAGDDWESTDIHLTTEPDELPRWEARIQTFADEAGIGRDININSRNQDVELRTFDDAVEWVNQQRSQHNMPPVTVGDRTIYGEYLEPGGKKYRELLLTLPNIPKPRNAVASDEPAQKVWYLLNDNDDIAATFHSREAAWTEYQSLSPQEKNLYRVEEDVLGTKPPPQKYGSGHWPGYDNVLAHIRFDERVDPKTGKKILMIDEIQSDWHQEGRTRGYAPRSPVSPQRLKELGEEKDRIYEAAFQRDDGLSVAETRRLSQIEMELDPSGIPEAPFQNNWQALALKRMMRYAAENDYDRIEWWSGDPHVERWGTPQFKWVTEPEGFRVSAVEHVPATNDPRNIPIRSRSVVVTNEDELNDFIDNVFSEEAQPGRREFAEGKDVISKLWGQMQAQPEGIYRPREEGLHYFYDKALPTEMGKLAKKFDATVTKNFQVNPKLEPLVDDYDNVITGPSATKKVKRDSYGVDITPKMRESVLYEGQPQFMALPPGLVEGGAGAAAGSQTEEDSGFSAGGALVGAALGINMAKLPKNGPWQERLARGLEVPEGATPRIKNMLNRAYGEAMRLLEKSQTVSGASRKIRFHTMANEAYRAYENLLSSGSPEGAARVAQEPRPLRRTTPERVPATPRPEPPAAAPRTAEEAAAADMAEDAYPFGKGPDVPEAEPTVPASIAPEARPGVADEFTVEPEPLPDELDPKTVIDQTQFKAIVARLQEDLAMNPAHVQALNDAVVKIMMAPGDIKGRHVDKLVRWAGNLRALPRGMTKEEAIEQYAQTQLRKAGLIADPTASVAAVADEVVPPTVEFSTGNLSVTPPTAANAMTGAGMGMLAEGDEEDYSWEAIAGGALVGSIFKKKKLDSKLVQKLAALDDDLTRSFRTPNQGATLKGAKFSERAYEFWQTANVQLFDELGRLQGFQNDLAREFQKQTGARLPAQMLFAELKRFDFSNRAKIDVSEYIEHGAVKTLADAGIPQENFDRYLMARQNVDIVHAQQADPKPPGPHSQKPYVGDLTRQFPGNSSYEKEVTFLQDFEKLMREEGKWDAVQGAAEDIWALSGRMLDLLEGGGLIDNTLADTLRTKYPHYIPTRILEKLGDNSFTPPSKSMSIGSNQIRELTLEGTSKDALNPTAAMTAAIYQVHAAVQKNIVANAFIDAWDTAAGRINTFDDASDIISGDGVKSAGQFIPDLTTDIGRRIQRHVDGIQPWPVNDAVPAGWSPLTNFRNGVKEKYIVSDELAPLVNFAKPDNIKIVSAAMNFFRQAVTTRNPVFLASNMFLDLSSFLIREGSRANGPHHIPEVFGEWFKSMLEFVVSPAAWADMGEGRYSGDMARALMQGGGMSGGYFPGGVQPAKKIGVIDWIDGTPQDIDAMLKKYNIRDPRSPIVKEVENMRRGAIEIDTAGGVARMLKDVLTFKVVENIGERIEAAPRVAAMRLSEKRVNQTLQILQQERARTAEALSGLDTGPGSGIGQKLKEMGLRSLDSIDAEIKDTEARKIIEGTQAYRTTTIDFNKGGTFSRFVNQIIPFFNVGMQSIADVPRAFAENKVAYPATVITGVVLPVILAEEWNSWDEQRAKDYADIPTHVKDQGLVVMLPGEAPVDDKGNRVPQYFHFRYRQLAPIAALTREMLQRTWYREQLPAENEQRGWGEVAGSAASMVSPVPVDDPAEFAVGLVPPVLGTGIQAAIDRDLFRGKRITSEFADDRASPLSKAIYERMNKPDWMRPSMVEFITRDAAGGYANFWHGVANKLDGRKTPGVAGVPVVGPFAGRFVKGGGGGKSQIAREHLLTPSAEQILKDHNVSWRPSPVDYKIGDVPLTLSEYGDYQREVNIAVDKTIQETSRKAEFLVKSPGEKKEMVERYVGLAKDSVRNKFLARIPQAERAKRRKLEDEKEKKGWTGIWSDPPSANPSSSSTTTTTTTTTRSAPTRSSPIFPATRP